jgi:hypothetical protein
MQARQKKDADPELQKKETVSGSDGRALDQQPA